MGKPRVAGLLHNSSAGSGAWVEYPRSAYACAESAQHLYICGALWQLRSMSLTAEAIVELFERDARARKRLAELLVSEPDVRLAIINAVLRDVATKSDIEKVREEISKIRGEYATKSDIEKVRAEYATKEDVKILRDEIEKIRADLVDVRERLSKLEGIVSQLVERISDLDKRIDSLDKRLDYVAKISWTLTAGVIATLIANIVILIITHGIVK